MEVPQKRWMVDFMENPIYDFGGYPHLYPFMETTICLCVQDSSRAHISVRASRINFAGDIIQDLG